MSVAITYAEVAVQYSWPDSPSLCNDVPRLFCQYQLCPGDRKAGVSGKKESSKNYKTEDMIIRYLFNKSLLIDIVNTKCYFLIT